MPSNQTSDVMTEIDILKELYAAINRNDIAAATKFFHPQIERIEPAGFPSAGTYRGVKEIETHLNQGRGTWAEGTCEPEQFIVEGGKFIVFLHVHVRLKNKTDWIDGRFADGFTFTNNNITLMRTFATREEAIDWGKDKA